MLCNKSELQWTLPFWRNHYFQWRCGIPRKKWGNRTNQTANDHGSLACITGQWYIFHHRQTHSGTFSRQACAEPVRIAGDGSIAQVECTSMGFHRGALETKGSYPAIISCVLTNGAMPHITNTLIQEDIIFSARPKMWWVLLRQILSGAFVPYRH